MKEIFGEKGLDIFFELACSIIYVNGNEGAKKQGNRGIQHKKRTEEEVEVEVQKDPDFEPAHTDEESDEDDDDDETIDGNNSETEPPLTDAWELEVPNNISSPYEFHNT